MLFSRLKFTDPQQSKKDHCPQTTEHAPLQENCTEEPDEACYSPAPSRSSEEPLTSDPLDKDYTPSPSEDELLVQESQSSCHDGELLSSTNSSNQGEKTTVLTPRDEDDEASAVMSSVESQWVTARVREDYGGPEEEGGSNDIGQGTEDTDMQPLLAIKEETLPEHQEQDLSVDQEGIKEEEEKLWISQQGKQLEADLTKFDITAITVKSEYEGEKPEFSQLHQSRSDDITEAEPVASSSSGHRTLTAQDDGENDGGPQTSSYSGPNSHLQPDTSSGTETDDSDDWKQTRELQSSFSRHSGNTDKKDFKGSKYVKASGHMNNSEQQIQRQASAKSFSCSDQSKRQKQKGTLSKTIRIQTGQKSFVCSRCGQKFGQKGHLKTHMIIHTGKKAYVCSECGQKFGQKGNLKRHTAIHTGQKAFVCSECGQKFGQKGNLNTHMIIHTGQKPFVCSECGQTFGQKGSLNTHMMNHAGQKPFVCSECGQRFVRKSSLNRHMIIHTGEKAFVCFECGQRFVHKSSLYKHMIIHTGQKPFVCSECGQRFGQKATLNTHMIIHTGQKPFVCFECGQRFVRKSSMYKHMIIHTGQIPFVHSECGKDLAERAT